ncbi:hypothetical protein WISP_88797 [Willisornis vidua]|uniref:Uncharacterized protein n=1 Tax=Willisornis vidua TaxID=1566151 RepID=A0ABQ9D802_9PASS|nr:hypothetical protein WISP_88797 [Willisornis vidua]
MSASKTSVLYEVQAPGEPEKGESKRHETLDETFSQVKLCIGLAQQGFGSGDHGEAAVPPQSVELCGGSGIHLQPIENSKPEQVMSKEVCDPKGRPCWSRLLAEPVALWREEIPLDL